jgi:hypothetical protein
MGRPRLKWDEAAFVKIVAEARNAKDAAARFKSDYGSTRSLRSCYRAVMRLIKTRGLDTSHFKLGSTGLAPACKVPLAKILVKNSPYMSTHRIKLRCIEAGLLRNECYACGLGPKWSGKTLALQLDHINGVNDDHRIKNLRVLCPNCHSQTDTWCARNKDRLSTKRKEADMNGRSSSRGVPSSPSTHGEVA